MHLKDFYLKKPVHVLASEADSLLYLMYFFTVLLFFLSNFKVFYKLEEP